MVQGLHEEGQKLFLARDDIEVFTKCKFDGVLDLNRTHVQINNSFNLLSGISTFKVN